MNSGQTSAPRLSAFNLTGHVQSFFIEVFMHLAGADRVARKWRWEITHVPMIAGAAIARPVLAHRSRRNTSASALEKSAS